MNISKINSQIDNFFNGCHHAQHLKKTDSDLIDVCIDKAWPDTIARERYKGMANSTILQNKDAIKKAVKERLSNILIGDFNDWHKKACTNPLFGMPVGMWQKLINMTLKHMYVIYAKTGRLATYAPVFDSCHCPIDSHIAKIALSDIKNRHIEATFDQNIIDLLESVSVSGKTTWNNLDYETYIQIQNTIRTLASIEELSPMEYDVAKWA